MLKRSLPRKAQADGSHAAQLLRFGHDAPNWVAGLRSSDNPLAASTTALWVQGSPRDQSELYRFGRVWGCELGGQPLYRSMAKQFASRQMLHLHNKLRVAPLNIHEP